MTGPRRQQKPPLKGLVPALMGAALLATVAVVPSFRGMAATTERIAVDPLSGLALAGYDPVAYFTEGVASPGRPDLEYDHAGAPWRFRNEGNRAAFMNNPDVYAPRFGGYDPVHLARGVPMPGDPRLWTLRGQRLYLFYTAETRDRFAGDAERVLTAAEQHWPGAQRTLTP